jgi:GNAT superfamily N-acetyltransferase
MDVAAAGSAGFNPDLLARAHAALAERFRIAARRTDGGVIEESDGMLLALLGPLLPAANSALVTRVPADPAAVIARARTFFARHGVGWSLKAAGAAATALAPAAAAAGLRPGEALPALLLTPLTGEPAVVAGLAIEPVRDTETLRIFQQTSAGFGTPAAVFEMLYPPAVLDEPSMTLYVGFLDGVPAATAVRITSHRIAGIGGVTTLPPYRRRGIGEAITWHAALAGRDEGCIASALESTRMGYSIYRRMGYRQFAVYRTWEAMSAPTPGPSPNAGGGES